MTYSIPLAAINARAAFPVDAGTANDVHLPGVHANALKLFVDCLYTGEPIDREAFEDEEALGIYILASRWKCHDLQNQALDIFINDRGGCYPYLPRVVWVAELNLGDSKLACFLLKELAYSMYEEGVECRGTYRGWDDFLKLCPNMVRRLFIELDAMHRERRDSGRDPADPTNTEGCEFHVHATKPDLECTREWMRQ